MPKYTLKESIHMCDSCGKELSSIKDLAKHKKWHDDQENTTCPKCELQFDDKISYRNVQMFYIYLMC
jgi:hypothetical protein